MRKGQRNSSDCYQPSRPTPAMSKPGGPHCELCGIHHASIPPLTVIVTSRSFLKGNGKYCNAFPGFVFFPTALFLSLGCSLIVRGYGCLNERRSVMAMMVRRKFVLLAKPSELCL